MSGPKLASGEISICPYEDGSGDRLTVKFSNRGDFGPSITVEQFSDCHISVEMECVMPLIAAISRAYEELSND